MGEDWLQLRSGPPGLESPYLLEFRCAYRALDCCVTPPRLVACIGGKAKQLFLKTLLSPRVSARQNGVALRVCCQARPSLPIASCITCKAYRARRPDAYPATGRSTLSVVSCLAATLGELASSLTACIGMLWLRFVRLLSCLQMTLAGSSGSSISSRWGSAVPSRASGIVGTGACIL